MNRKSLFGRLADSRTALRTAERQEYFRPNLELLEDRKLLVATVYYNDDWVNDTVPGVDPVAGNFVSHATDFGGATSSGVEYGFEAYGKRAGGSGSLPNIQNALDAVSTDDNATVLVGTGTHVQSDIVIQRPISLVGEDTIGVSNTVIIPQLASANTDGNFPSGTHSGIIIQMSSANLVFSGSDGVTISDLTLNGGLGSFSDNDYQHGVTTLFDTPGDPVTANGVTLTLAQWGFAGDAGTNETNPNLNIDGVTVRNTRQTGITVSPLIDQTYDTGSGELLALNIFNSTVENVGPAGTKDATRIGILMQNANDNQTATAGNITGCTVSNVGVGIKQGYFGTLDFGNQNAANNGSFATQSEVDDADVYAYWIQAAREEDNLGLIATGGASTGTGFFLDHSRLDGGTGWVSTGYGIGVLVQDTNFAQDITPYLAVADLTGPGTGVAGSVGILVNNTASYETILEVESVVTVTGFQTGIKVEQVVAHADPNILQLDRPILTGNATELYVGNNSRVVGNYDLNTDITIAGTGIIDPRATNAYNFDGDGPDFFINSTAQPGSPTPSPDKADTIAATNITLGSGTTYSALLTGESGSQTTMWDYNQKVGVDGSYPGVLVPPLNWDHTLTDPQTPYGALTDWAGQVVQDGDTDALVLGGTATNGHGLSYLYGGNFTEGLNGNNQTIYVVDPTDLTGRTHMNLELKLDATSAAKLILFGLVDSRGNTESWTIPTSMLNSTAYTTVRINMIAPSLELTENEGGPNDDDIGINLAEIAGYVFGGDQGLGTYPFDQDIPFGFSFDNYSHTSQKNSQLEVSGSIDLGSATLALELRSGYVPSIGDEFTIVNNTGGGGITGTFAGLPDGSTFLIGGAPFEIDYQGGVISPDNDGGNDVVVKRVAFTASVTGRHLFYNNSKYDANSPGIVPPTAGANNDDVDAIDTSKSAYLPGAGSSINPVSMSAYNKGINGVFVDITGTHGPLSLTDFQFAMSSTALNNTPSTWVAAPAPTAFTVLTGVPAAGTDRVEFIWPDNDLIANNLDIVNRYLEVTVEGNDAGGGSNQNTGLAASSYFYYGSRIGTDFVGEANPAATYITNAADEIGARTHPGFLLPVTNVWDYNKDSIVNAGDQIVARGNGGFQLKINITGPPPPAPAAFGDDGSGSAVASALAAPSSSGGGSDAGWVSTRLASVSLDSGPVGAAIAQLTEADSPGALGGSDGGDDDLDSLLDSILGDLG
ncbi:MAG: hypothetical protein WD063_11095 [Pirellulales bacterium]